MLQELWEIDQGQHGLKPQVWPGQHSPVPAHLCVDEPALVSGTVKALTLFPHLEWPSTVIPPSYTAFNDLLKAYRDKAPGIEAHERQFLSSFDQTTVMRRAREMMEELGDPLYSPDLQDDQHWIEFLHKFWFTVPRVSSGRPSESRSKEASFRDLLERYRSSKSTLSVSDAIELLVQKSEINISLFDEPLTALQSAIIKLGGQITPQQQQSPLRIAYQMAEDLRYIDGKQDSAQQPFMHIFVGDYYASDAVSNQPRVPLKGYHFWYKFYLDAYAVPDAMTAEGLRYGGTLDPLGKQTPELTTLAFTLGLTQVPGGRTIDFYTVRSGFLNGCSAEGWMALCMVAFFRLRHAIRSRTNMRNQLLFTTASDVTAEVRLVVGFGAGDFSDLLLTAYPVLVGTST